MNSLGLCAAFADLDAFVPRVSKLFVAGTSAGFEPSTSATAATGFAGFPDDAAPRAFVEGGRRRHW